jgi:hypothetical protein
VSRTATNYLLDCGNVNINTLAGKSAGGKAVCTTSLTITAAMITATRVRVAFPFTVGAFTVDVRSAAGVAQFDYTDAFTIDNGDVLIALAAGVGDIVATDVVTISATE